MWIFGKIYQFNLFGNCIRITLAKIFILVFLFHRKLSDKIMPSKPILFGDEASPPVRFAMITASLLGVDLHFHTIDLFRGGHKTEFYKKVLSIWRTILVSKSYWYYLKHHKGYIFCVPNLVPKTNLGFRVRLKYDR